MNKTGHWLRGGVKGAQGGCQWSATLLCWCSKTFCATMLTLCAFLMVPSADTLYNFELLCCYFELLCCYLCYSTTAHSAYTPLQLESARLYTTVGARVGLAPSRLPASNTTAGDQRVEGPTRLLGPGCPSRGGGSSLPKGKSERGTRLRGGTALAEQPMFAKKTDNLQSTKKCSLMCCF